MRRLRICLTLLLALSAPITPAQPAMADSPACRKPCSPAVEEIAVAVVEHDGRFVVGLRSPDAALGGLAEFPGGKVEPGETAAQAAVRECREETGLDVAAGGQYGEVVHAYPAEQASNGRAFTVSIHFIACRPLDDGQPLRSPFRWVAAAELGQLDFPEANAELICQLTAVAPTAPGRSPD